MQYSIWLMCAEYVCIVTAVSSVLTTLKALSLWNVSPVWKALMTVLPPWLELCSFSPLPPSCYLLTERVF